MIGVGHGEDLIPVTLPLFALGAGFGSCRSSLSLPRVLDLIPMNRPLSGLGPRIGVLGFQRGPSLCSVTRPMFLFLVYSRVTRQEALQGRYNTQYCKWGFLANLPVKDVVSVILER